MAFVNASRNNRREGLPNDRTQGFLALRPDDFQDEYVWFLGDVHGDLLGFLTVLDFIKEKSEADGKDFKVVFMGDLVDDSHDMIHIVYEVVKRIMENDGQYCWLAGNHDEGTKYSETEEGIDFYAIVHPAGFADWIEDEEGNRELGKRVIDLVKKIPRAIFFPKGFMASHAGFPHNDIVFDNFNELDDTSTFTGERAMQDFVWARLKSGKVSIPNRSSKSHELGARNFLGEDFKIGSTNIVSFSNRLHAAGLTEITGEKLGFLVRGHDHCDTQQARWNRYESKKRNDWESRALTINNMCFDARNTSFFCDHFVRFPVTACWNSAPNESPFPQPFALDIPLNVVDAYAPRCSQNVHANNPLHKDDYVNRMDAEKCEGFFEDEDGKLKICNAELSNHK